MDKETGRTKDLAYYYSGWIWPPDSSDWMKSLLLFFDGLALALPPALAAEVVDHDPVLAQPLMERGLLTNFAPSSWLDPESAELLATTLLELVSAHRSWWQHGERFMRLTPAHWGIDVAPEPADAFLRELRRRGLVTGPSADGLVNMHHSVRQLVLTMFVSVLESCVRRSSEVRLQPTTDDDLLGKHYMRVLERYLRFDYPDHYDRDFNWLLRVPSRGPSRVGGMAMFINRDLDNVGVDLSSVPLDEVLEFRREQGQHYRAYARSLRQVLADVELRTDSEYQAALARRQEEIRDMGADLRRKGRKAFGRKSVVSALSLAGATWTAIHGDPIGAALAAIAVATGVQRQEIPVSSYSYLFVAHNDIGSPARRGR